MRSGILVLGVCLIMLAVIGFVDRTDVWLSAVHLALLVALASIATLFLPDGAPRLIAAAPVALSATLILAGMVGLQRGVEPWLCWANVTYGLAYLLPAVAMRPVGARSPARSLV